MINRDSIKRLDDNRYFYLVHRGYNYVPNDDLQTFCEVKNYNPYPELIYSFLGLILALKHDIIKGSLSSKLPKHISPCLAISGNGNYHTGVIREKLMDLYNINIFFNLFNYNGIKKSLRNSNIKKIGSNNPTFSPPSSSN